MKKSNTYYTHNENCFSHIARFWITNFATEDMKDVSLGVHVCWDGRVDIHIGTYMLSLGKVPIYFFRTYAHTDEGIKLIHEEKIAYNNSSHKRKLANKTRFLHRSGVPIPKPFLK
jgi:hypothetical protein